MQRSSGEARTAFRRAGMRTVAFDHYQRGCAKVRVPRSFADPEAIFINTAGGLTDGDTISVTARWETDASAVVTTQAAERVYRARRDRPAIVRNHVIAADGATAAWLPQPTILFEGARLDRALDATLFGNATFLGCETIVFGRTAMGETVSAGSLFDAWRIERDGKLLFIDRLGLDGDVRAALSRKAGANGAIAVATLVYAGADSAHKRDAVRSVLPPGGTAAGCSDLGEVLVVRLLAPTEFALRRQLVAVLEILRGREGVPHLWRL
ncbi:MAG: urease accessory protein UreD [Hyphomicrobiales bacterium]